MRYLIVTFLLLSFSFAKDFDTYLKNFDYKARTDMKIKTFEMLNLLEEDKVQVIDIRFPEEVKTWSFGFAKNIPLNELPNRLDELDKDKLIVTVCPHNDRANIARMYLMLKGYNARYLSDGLLNTADYLRGDRAKEFLEEVEKLKK
jgi:rhodanese-related sulfurtransferase